MVRVEVQNPAEPLPRDDPLNAWHLGLESMGSSLSRRQVNASGGFSAFSLLGENFTSSVAVLGRLTHASLQPQGYQPSLSDFMSDVHSASAGIGMQVFFRTAQILTGGTVVLQAPSGFDFGNPCQVSNLPSKDHYYAIAKAGDTRRLPYLDCRGDQDGETVNVAMIMLSTRLFAQETYGWQILVRPPRLGLDSKGEWMLYTQVATGRIDGTPTAVPSSTGDPYQLYYRSLASLHVHISDLKPKELTGKEAMVHVLFRLGGIVLNSYSALESAVPMFRV